MTSSSRHAAWLAVSLLLVASIEAVDVLTGHMVGLTPLYMLAVGLVAWKVGRVAGLVLSGLIAIVWIGADFALLPPDEPLWATIADAIAQFVVSVLTVLALTAIRRAQRARDRLVRDLEQALANVRTLTGLLPVCAWCKRIRQEEGGWTDLERYVAQRTEADFTHGICPECVTRME